MVLKIMLVSALFGSSLFALEPNRVFVDIQSIHERCLLMKEAALALEEVQKELEALGLGLKICEPNENTGVDVTLIDEAGDDLEMPSSFDDLTDEAKTNRNFLKSVMENHGFRALGTQWWHFDFEVNAYE